MADPTTTFKAHEKYARPLAFAESGRTLYTGGFDGTVSAWNTGEWTERVTVQAHEQSVNCGTLTAEGNLVTGSTDTTLRVWSPGLDEQVQSLSGHTKTIAAVASHPSHPMVASASYDGTVRVWSLNEDDPPQILSGHSGNVTAVQFVTDTTMISGGLGDAAVVWSLDTGAELSRLDGHGQAVSGIAALGELQLWSVGYNGVLRRWDTDEWTPITEQTLSGAAKPTGIAVHPHSGGVAITRDGGVDIYSDGGKPERELTANIKGIYNPVWSPDGEMVCVGGADGKIRLYR